MFLHRFDYSTYSLKISKEFPEICPAKRGFIGDYDGPPGLTTQTVQVEVVHTRPCITPGKPPTFSNYGELSTQEKAPESYLDICENAGCI